MPHNVRTSQLTHHSLSQSVSRFTVAINLILPEIFSPLRKLRKHTHTQDTCCRPYNFANTARAAACCLSFRGIQKGSALSAVGKLVKSIARKKSLKPCNRAASCTYHRQTLTFL
jgi:hypothetical protein